MGHFNLVAGEMAGPSESLSSLMYKLQSNLMKAIFSLPTVPHMALVHYVQANLRITISYMQA